MTWSPWYTTAGVALLLCFWVVGAHNRVVALRAAIHAAWVPLEAMLAERVQVVQALSEAMGTRLPAEAATIEAARAASRQVSVALATVRQHPAQAEAVAGLAAAEAALEPALGRLLALLAPDGPQGQDGGLASPLQALSTLQARLPFGREAFNSAARRYNDAVRQFPTHLLGPLLRFGRAGML